MRTDRVETLLTRMREAEWVIERTANGHYRAKAPDGLTVIHVPGKNGPGRSLINTEAMFNRWVKRQDKPAEERKQYVCTTCGETFDSHNGFNAHGRIHEMTDVVCEVCGGTYRSGNGITRHMRATHKTEVKQAEALPEASEIPAVPEPDVVTKDSLLAISEDLLALADRVEQLARREREDGDLRERLRALLGG